MTEPTKEDLQAIEQAIERMSKKLDGVLNEQTAKEEVLHAH